jgi:hypothetical protein
MELTFEQQYEARVDEAIAHLVELTEHAEATRESGKEARALANAFDKVIGLYALNVDVIARNALNLSNPVVDELARIRADLGALGADGTEGAEASARLLAMLQSGITIDADLAAKAREAVDAWAKVAPSKSAGGTRAGKGEGKGTSVRLTCSCGWSTVDSTDTNSARWMYGKHLQSKAHGWATKPGKGETSWQAITDTIDPVSKGAETTTGPVEIAEGITLSATADAA